MLSLTLTGRSPIADLTGATTAEQRINGFTLRDASTLPRYGCKGPGAIDWLNQQGYPIPAAPNTALPLSDGSGWVLRLGMTEFLIETSAEAVAALAAQPRTAGVYPVLRQDACFVLAGRQLNDILLQTCNVNFLAAGQPEHPVVLTSMVGVSVVLQPDLHATEPSIRIWCDGTFGHYLWQTLMEILTG